MNPAAEPPRQPPIIEADRLHPLFNEYLRHRTSCTAQLIQCSSFADWLSQRQEGAVARDWQAHPRFREFQTWMREHRGGARPCPGGPAFPANFAFWLKGGRW